MHPNYNLILPLSETLIFQSTFLTIFLYIRRYFEISVFDITGINCTCIIGDFFILFQIFEETKAIITSCADGYNVCLLAYGQTGSGKTFTMMGPEKNPGINVR